MVNENEEEQWRLTAHVYSSFSTVIAAKCDLPAATLKNREKRRFAKRSHNSNDKSDNNGNKYNNNLTL